MRPLRLSIAVKLVIFITIVEFLIMFIFSHLNITKHIFYLEAFLDTIILAVVISFGLNFLLSRPLKQMLKAMERVAKNDLDVRLEFKQKDEVGRLAQNFNQMVSSLKKLEEENLEKNQFIETITQGIEEDLVLLDAHLKILWANKRSMQTYGFKNGEIIDNYCYMKDKSGRRPEELCMIDKAVSTGKPNTTLHTRIDKEGNKSYVEVTVYPVRDIKGQIVRFIHAAYDVTEKVTMIEELKSAKAEIKEHSRILENKVVERTRDLLVSIKEADERRRAIVNMLEDINEAHRKLTKANQELREAQKKLIQSAKMAAVGQLAGGVAHEINNPLTGVLNNIQLIKMEAEAKKDFNLAEFKEILDVVEESALRCKRITQGLLNFSRVGKGPHQPTNINEAIEATLILAESEIRIENIKLIKEFSSEPLLVLADSQQLQQVFLDIINNAKWAMQEKKQGELRIKTHLSPEHKSVMITFFDTGCGIPPENLSHIFEPFFTTKKTGEGTGLGLSICYGIIKEHSGTIQAESEGKDKGAAFRITLPAIK